MGIITCFGDRSRSGTFFMIADNFMCVFGNGVTSPRIFSNLNLTYGFKSFMISGIKIAADYKRSIFQAEWLIATLI